MLTEQRRHYSRVPFQEGAALVLDGQRIACEVRDLSLKGALLLCPAGTAGTCGSTCELSLALGEGGEVIVAMHGELVHAEARDDGLQLGLVCREIDLDSITHLRRLVELNLGDAALLEREFKALIHG